MYDDLYGVETFLLMLLSIFLGTVVMLVVAFTIDHIVDTNKPIPACSSYSSYSVQDVPARCLSYFENEGSGSS